MCINSFFGIPLQKAVLWGGIFKLVLTLIFAIISVVSLSQLCKGVTDKAKCVGPQIRQVRHATLEKDFLRTDPFS